MEQALPDIAEKVYNTVQEAELDLEAGRVDAMLADKLLMYDWVTKVGMPKGYDYVGQPVVSPLVSAQVGIAVKKGNAALAQSLNGAIDQLLADPAYDKIVAGYFPFSIRP
jgi:ABC-type amino acid transport substrate-binding protein